MTHPHKAEEETYGKFYYVVGILSGLFTGVVIDHGIGLTVGLGVFGYLFTAFFRQILVRNRADI